MTHNARSATEVIESWPAESKEAASLVLAKRGEPDEVSESFLVWHNPDPWKRIVAGKNFLEHSFPAPHIDSVESVVAYDVPVEKVSALAEFDGSVIVERTAGEISARCHDEEANYLALNLAHDIITDQKSVAEARRYYAEEFLNARRGGPTPYMEGLRFEPEGRGDSDRRVISEGELERARRQGGG